MHVAGVFCSGLLVGGDTYAYKKAPAEMVQRAQAWRALAAKHGCSLPAVAIAFAALPTCVSRVVLGMASARQVDENMRWVAEAAKCAGHLGRGHGDRAARRQRPDPARRRHEVNNYEVSDDGRARV